MPPHRARMSLHPLPADAIEEVRVAADCTALGFALHDLRAAVSSPETDPDHADITADLRGGLNGLQMAIKDFPEAPFFGAGGLLSYIISASQPESSIEVPLLIPPEEPREYPGITKGSPVAITAEVELSRKSIETILARMFLCALPQLRRGCGRLSCATLLGCPSHGALDTAAEKLKCFLGYFCQKRSESKAHSSGTVRFVRAAMRSSRVGPFWEAADTRPIADCSFVWGTEMQESRGSAIVDFANEQFGYGIIPSATQEEMIMCARPEALVGCAIATVMADHEAVLIARARHIVHCSKPSGSSPFRYLGLCAEETQTESILIGVDAFKALLDLQLEVNPATQIRDIRKVVVGFAAAAYMASEEDVTLITGAWGCGAFGCDQAVKFMQQLLAATVTGVRLQYTVYGVVSNDQYTGERRSLQDLYEHLRANNCTLDDLWQLLLQMQFIASEANDFQPQDHPKRTMMCTRTARRWRATREELQQLDGKDADIDAKWEEEHSRTSQPCGGGCGFGLPLSHPTGICGICSSMFMSTGRQH